MKQIKKVAAKWTLVTLALGLALGLAACGSGGPGPESRLQPENTPVAPASISMVAPDTGWHLRVRRVLELESEIWVLVQLERNPGAAAQMIQTVQAAMPVSVPSKPRRVFVAGKTWAWSNDEPYEFVPSLDAVERRAGHAKVLYAEPGR